MCESWVSWSSNHGCCRESSVTFPVMPKSAREITRTSVTRVMTSARSRLPGMPPSRPLRGRWITTQLPGAIWSYTASRVSTVPETGCSLVVKTTSTAGADWSVAA